MSIECYDIECPFHSCHSIPNDGPFCDEEDCHFSNCDMSDEAKYKLSIEKEGDAK